MTYNAKLTALHKALTPIHPEQDRIHFAPKLAGDIRIMLEDNLNYLNFNTIDENGTIWVISDMDGWWNISEPVVPNIERGFGDGSFSVNGRFLARDITITGSILISSRDRSQIATLSAAARTTLLSAFNIVKRGTWLIVDEDEYKRSAYIRLSGRPDVKVVNSNGRIDFSFGVRAGDPLKYEWIDASTVTLPSGEPSVGNGYNVGLINSSSSTTTATGNAGLDRYQVYGFVGGNGIAPVKYQGYTLYPYNTGDGTTNSYYTLRTANEIGSVGTAGIINNGNSPVFVYLRIIGPLYGPATLQNITTNQKIDIIAPPSGAIGNPDIYGGVSPGSTTILANNSSFLDIDTQQREVHTGTYAAGESSSSARGLLTPLVDWIYLEPGMNTFYFTDFGALSGTTEASVQVYWRSGWIS